MSWFQKAGLRRPDGVKRLLAITLTATAVLLPLSHWLKRAVIAITGTEPDLRVFHAVRDSPSGLLAGLAVAWVCGAFLEELLLRGFLFNLFLRLDRAENGPGRMALAGAVLATSILAGFGHMYQGLAGAITAGGISAGFGVIYLLSRPWDQDAPSMDPG